MTLPREHIPGTTTDVLGMPVWISEPPANRRWNPREDVEQGAQGTCGLGRAGSFLWLSPCEIC